MDSLDTPALDPDDDHHLRRVLRVRDGDEFTVSDGDGAWAPAELRGGEVVLTGERRLDALRGAHVTIAAAIPKGDRLEWMAHRLTEVGVDHIILLDCERSVVRWTEERAYRHLARLRRVIREAGMQSRRTRLPAVVGPVPFAQVSTAIGTVVADPDGVALQRSTRQMTVAIGPEGGFSADELFGARLASVGRHVLRVETAAIAAAVLLCR